MSKPALTYLFEATLEDGSIYSQNPEDASLKFPPVPDENGVLQGKSCFTDIIEDVENHKVVKFSLIGKGNVVSVDLRSGLFEINGLPILAESVKLPTKPDHFTLVYYRQRTISQNVTYQVQSGEIIDKEEGEEFLEYFIGWRCNISGRDYEQKIAVA